MHNGNSILGKDGILYRSEVEKKFADTYLYKKYDYSYEHPYAHGTKYTCDFYLPQLKMWVEIVPVEERLGEDVEEVHIRVPPFIDTSLPYSDRERGKDMGAKWDARRKVWCISSQAYFVWKNNDKLKYYLPPPHQIEKTETIITPADPNWKPYFDTIKAKRKIVTEKYKETFVVVCADLLKKSNDNSLMLLLVNRGQPKALLNYNDFCTTLLLLEKMTYNVEYNMEKIALADTQKSLLEKANSTIHTLTVENKNLTKCIREVNNKVIESRQPPKPSGQEIARRNEARRKKKLRQKLRKAGQPIPVELLP